MSAPAAERVSAAPHPTFRLIPSRFPPIGLFDTVATPADMEAAMELAGWTNDRLVAERIARLPRADWVYGRPNASIVMAAFLHVQPGGSRFNSPDLGAWYASAALTTAAAEVGHHLRREAVATGQPTMRRQYRCYQARLSGRFVDIRGQREQRPEVYDPRHLGPAQSLGESVRASDQAGIIWESLRHVGGVCVVSFRPTRVLDITQTDHFEMTVTAASSRIELRRLSASEPAHAVTRATETDPSA